MNDEITIAHANGNLAASATYLAAIPAKHRAIAMLYRNYGGSTTELVALLNTSRSALNAYRNQAGKLDVPGYGSVYLWDAYRYAADAEGCVALGEQRDKIVAGFQADEDRLYRKLLEATEAKVETLDGDTPAHILERITRTAVTLLADRRKGLGLDVAKLEHSGHVTTSTTPEQLAGIQERLEQRVRDRLEAQA